MTSLKYVVWNLRLVRRYLSRGDLPSAWEKWGEAKLMFGMGVAFAVRDGILNDTPSMARVRRALEAVAEDLRRATQFMAQGRAA